MNAPGRRAERPAPRAGLAAQIGQTMIVLGVGVLFIGLFLEGAEEESAWVGGVLVLAGAILFVVGLRRRTRRPPG